MSENIRCEHDNDSLIPEGKYNAKCIKSEINNRFRGKVKLELKIISGKYNGTIVARHYNVYRAKKPGPDGEVVWKDGTKSAYIREWKRLFGKTDGDYPHSIFNGKCFLIEVATVKRDFQRREIGEINHYSKADYIFKEINCQENIEDDWS
jgi:hypothetical protein